MKAVITGSFYRFRDEIFKAKKIFEGENIQVLFPKKDIEILSRRVLLPDEFMRYFSLLDTKANAVLMCDFVYVMNPGGYVGIVACKDVGTALALGKRIYAYEPPADDTIRMYIAKCFKPGSINI